MRHRKQTIKLGRTSAHRRAMLAGLVCDLIHSKRITTTLAKAKATRVLAEKMVTLGKGGTLAQRRIAIARLRQPERVKVLFEEIAPSFQERSGGYTRIVKLGKRASDSSEMVILEWVEPGTPTSTKPRAKAKSEAEAVAVAIDAEAEAPA